MMSITTTETTITRGYLKNKTKDEIIDHVMRLLKENDALSAEILLWKGNAESVRRVCEKAGYATRFGKEGVHVIGGGGITRDLADPVLEMALNIKQYRYERHELVECLKGMMQHGYGPSVDYEKTDWFEFYKRRAQILLEGLKP